MKIFNLLKHGMFQQKIINQLKFMQKMLHFKQITIQIKINNLIKILKNCANMIKKII